ncbi:MAG: dihydropteroate synthase [Hyphomicrobiaceae bacterium]|nr:MAG: dihydropteroate synthase [Hyphomicrobiaceae bacterium]
MSAPGSAPAITVAGRSDLLFAGAEVIEREEAGVRRSYRTAGEFLSDGSGAASGLSTLMERLCRPRPPISGLTLNRPRVMGIINVTPDSFSDGGRYLAQDAAIEHGFRLEAEGAEILDIGGESTRPGSEAVDLDEECRRVLPVIAALTKRSRALISIDTRKAEVMRRAALEGAHLINDVSALTHDPNSLGAAAATGLPVVLMHARGDPRTMQQNPTYDDVVLDVSDWLEARIEACEAAGIPRARLIVDPGIGFGKTLAHNLALLGSLSLYHGLGCALLLGASRKSFIGKLMGAGVDERLPGSLAAALIGSEQGAQILRVHDVAATRQALAVWEGARAA